MNTPGTPLTDRDRKLAEAAGMRIITAEDAEWPHDTLRDVGPADRPRALWLRGATRLDEALRDAVTFDGTGAPSTYGEFVASDWAYALAQERITTVASGGYGIPAAAHRGALAADGRTVAVLPCGLDAGYPSGHNALFQGIADNGVLVSEYPPRTPPSKQRARDRLRLLTAFGAGTVIVEADVRGGTLTIARLATALGRAAMAVPGPITSRPSLGCNQLIRDGQASLVANPADVLDSVRSARDER